LALNDILTAAFDQEEQSKARQAMGPSVSPSVAPPPPMPMMPFQSPQPQAGQNLASLLPLLLGQKSGNNPGNSGSDGFSPGEGSGHEGAIDIANWIEHRPGFEVGGLEGWQGQGSINSGHVANSQHYTGEAGDVNYVGGGRFNGEMPALDWLDARLDRRFGDMLTELIWREPDHFDHLHYGTRPGG